jgi:hypothetical protein
VGCSDSGGGTMIDHPSLSEEQARTLILQILKDHDTICSALRTGIAGKKLFKAIDRMTKVKAEWRD